MFLNSSTVHDDEVADYLYGSNGSADSDWFFGTSGSKRDVLFNRVLRETVTYYY